MVVKSKRGRIRYIAFDVPADLRKETLIKEVNSTGGGHLYIVQCTGGKAVVRCAPGSREEAVRILTQAEPSCVSLMTSGTLRKIRGTYPELKVTKK